jgi:hypothetical protein
MEWWYPIVIGSVAFSYVHLFLYNAGKSGVRTHATIRQEILSLPR